MRPRSRHPPTAAPGRPRHEVRALLLVSALALAGCEVRREGAENREPDPGRLLFAEAPASVEHGKASYYYGRWIGRLTANGETYHANDVTAAHKRLPFNTYVRVHNLANGRSIVVRINNRGPYVRGRVIDLSLRAARHLHMEKAGVVPVRLEILTPLAEDTVIRDHVQNRQFESRQPPRETAPGPEGRRPDDAGNPAH